MKTTTAQQLVEFTAEQLKLHYGPGPHPDGSPQAVHGGGANPAAKPPSAQMGFDFEAQTNATPYDGVTSDGHVIKRASVQGDVVTTVTSRTGNYRQTWRERDGQVIDWSETQFKKWRGKNQWVERENWLIGRKPLPFPVPRTAEDVPSNFGAPVSETAGPKTVSKNRDPYSDLQRAIAQNDQAQRALVQKYTKRGGAVSTKWPAADEAERERLEAERARLDKRLAALRKSGAGPTGPTEAPF